MTEADVSTAELPDIEGMSVEEATAAVLAAAPQFEERTVRGILATVAEHGDDEEGDDRLTWAAVEGKLAHLSKVVSTPETRVELAEIALEDALEAAGEDRERTVVQSRLDGHAARLDGIQRRVNELAPRLQRLTESDEDLFAVAHDIVQLERQANELQAEADDLQLELEEFETWVGNARTRFDELDGDLNALAETLDQTDDGVDRIAVAVEEGETGQLTVEDPALAWVDATFTHEVLELLVADLAWEFDALCAWSDEDGDDVAERVERLATRLVEVEARVDRVGERLADLRRETWAERFADERAAFAADLEETAPPVNWGRVQATLGEHRERLRAD
jgi:DNA repair exonuclease SbcCD ATPase subunit